MFNLHLMINLFKMTILFLNIMAFYALIFSYLLIRLITLFFRLTGPTILPKRFQELKKTWLITNNLINMSKTSSKIINSILAYNSHIMILSCIFDRWLTLITILIIDSCLLYLLSLLLGISCWLFMYYCLFLHSEEYIWFFDFFYYHNLLQSYTTIDYTLGVQLCFCLYFLLI